MKRAYLILSLLLALAFNVNAQKAIYELPNRVSSSDVLKTDGLVQPFLDDFLKLCKEYDIEYSDKLFKLKEIAIVDSLQMSSKGGTLGMLVRDSNNQVEKIVFSWMTLLDKEILKVVAFHEFGHYFLGYKHTCKDCNTIMAEVNTSYFDIVNDWDNQIKTLFLNSPEYLKKQRLTQH
ncbi:hypothetical protein [uncultured Lacinutrix sp.]|uniref:hypothetical protein n=1 Tax=uncultured Lacinutrix sp. TaxID=574032 RepID=UPI002602DB38|nr:hypothetical protein [uncultured Lacinutrix sp.]